MNRRGFLENILKATAGAGLLTSMGNTVMFEPESEYYHQAARIFNARITGNYSDSDLMNIIESYTYFNGYLDNFDDYIGHLKHISFQIGEEVLNKDNGIPFAAQAWKTYNWISPNTGISIYHEINSDELLHELTHLKNFELQNKKSLENEWLEISKSGEIDVPNKTFKEWKSTSSGGPRNGFITPYAYKGFEKGKVREDIAELMRYSGVAVVSIRRKEKNQEAYDHQAFKDDNRYIRKVDMLRSAEFISQEEFGILEKIFA